MVEPHHGRREHSAHRLHLHPIPPHGSLSSLTCMPTIHQATHPLSHPLSSDKARGPGVTRLKISSVNIANTDRWLISAAQQLKGGQADRVPVSRVLNGDHSGKSATRPKKTQATRGGVNTRTNSLRLSLVTATPSLQTHTHTHTTTQQHVYEIYMPACSAITFLLTSVYLILKTGHL